MSKAKTIIISILLAISCKIATSQWITVAYPPEISKSQYFNIVLKFTSEKKLWAYGFNYNIRNLYVSYNKGFSFEVLNSSLRPKSIQPLSDSFCFVLDGRSINDNTQYQIYKSSDGGKNFNFLPIITQSHDTVLKGMSIVDFYFYNNETGWVLSKDTADGCQLIYTTSNGGATWNRLLCSSINLNPKAFTYSQIEARKQDVGQGKILATDYRWSGFNQYNYYLRIDSFGNYWSEMVIDTGFKNLPSSFACLDSMIFVIPKSGKDFLITHDGGTNWEVRKAQYYVGPFAFAKPTKKRAGFLIANNSAFGSIVSLDTGITWHILDDLKDYRNMDFFNAEVGIAVAAQSFSATDVRIFDELPPWIVGIEESVSKKNTIRVYPNPANDKIILEGNLHGTHQIRIYNISGKLLQSHTQNTYQAIDISSLQAGLYFLQIQFEKCVKTIKLLIEK